MAPAYPEPLSLGLVPQDHDTPLLQDAPVLRRFPIREAPGFAVEVSDTPESVYLLGRPDGTEVPVPCRVCGTWNPAVLSGRHFFLSFEPDVALELSSVRRVTYHIGRLTFPSGWSASPWLAAPSRRLLLRRLHAFTEEFLNERLSKQSALSRAIGPVAP
ncbi:hypothetical protein [Gemmatimonas sp.]